MFQQLDVISVNLWQILISLANLVLLFLAVKKFFYAPVKKMLAQRQQSIEGDYDAAREAKENAVSDRKKYEEKLKGAKEEAERLIQSAVATADFREKEILEEAKEQADRILLRAKEDASLEKKKAEEEIRREIVEVSALLTEKVLGREVTSSDHDKWIADFDLNSGDKK